MNGPVNILLIDDNAKAQDLFGFALNDLQIDYSCRFARNVEQALHVLNTHPADYIFIDVNMPAIKSFRAIKKFFRTRILNKASIIIYTDHPETNLCKKAMSLGVLAGIKKKTEIFELIQDLKNLLHK